MITDQDVSKLKKTFVTKTDLAKLVKTLATKKDIEALATKKDLEAFATKKDLTALADKVDGLTYEVGDLKVEFAEMQEKVDSIEVTVAHIAGGVDTLLRENAAGTAWLKRHDRQIGALATHAGLPE
ncbi:MAG TPA: hypothetical protein VGN56_00125 [Candidatus Paceibacterota bacterium]|nr:hypothetical protein [Candidatus Paceibacterota bacterium]